MDFAALGSLAIVGVVISLFVQYVKAHLGGTKTQVAVVVLSVVAGLVALFFKAHPNYLATVGTVLASADVFYNYVLSYFEKA